MKINTKVFLIVFLVLSKLVFSQEVQYSAFLIPETLKEDANAVVRENSTEITIEDVDKMTVYKKEVVTVLNKLGNTDARIAESYDNDTKITKLSAIIYDALGNQIKKYKSKDFLDVSAVDGGTLYSDSRVKYVDYTPVSYPYTLVFESEYKTSSTGFIPSWFPVNGYYISIEKSRYKLNNPKKFKIRKKEKSFDGYPIQDNSTEFEVNYTLSSQKSIKYENSTPASIDFMPYLKVALNRFSLKGVEGFGANWKEFGRWENDALISGRDVLDEVTIQKVKNLVKGIEDKVEKAKIIYKFMQDRTRYISVQVGIGGWEPISANEVDKVGYGDCKGLTNYTKALLKIVDIDSYFTLVYANRKRNIDKDFASLQGNHAILNVPNEGKDIWLECTSQTMPFGFLGDFTDDRNVLVITPEGGIIKRTASYKDEVNLEKINGSITLDEKGNVIASFKRVSEGLQYDDKFNYENYTEEELIKSYKSDDWSYNNNLEIISAKIQNDRENIVFTEDLEISIKNYATINEQEFLFRVNVFNKNSFLPKRYRKRKLPLQISRGYKDVDEFKIKIPKGYVLGELPPIKELTTKFGTYKVSLKKIDDSNFSYHKSLVIKEGVYPKEDYKLYRSFRRSISKYENLRIAITKK